jgi:hypothetical protein
MISPFTNGTSAHLHTIRSAMMQDFGCPVHSIVGQNWDVATRKGLVRPYIIDGSDKAAHFSPQGTRSHIAGLGKLSKLPLSNSTGKSQHLLLFDSPSISCMKLHVERFFE